MTRPHTADVDIVKELRLRRWARENHVPADLRGPNWHPVVLDEMRARDTELDQLARDPLPGTQFAPLAPTSTRILHGPHHQLAGPHTGTRVDAPVVESWYHG